MDLGALPVLKATLFSYLGQLKISDPVSYMEKGNNSR